MMNASGGTLILILRVWQEPREMPDAAPIWRGVIEQVPGGERRYVDLPALPTPDDAVSAAPSLAPLCDVIAAYLAASTKEDPS